MTKSKIAVVLAVFCMLGLYGILSDVETSSGAEPTVDNPILFKVRGEIGSDNAVEYRIYVEGIYNQTYQSFNITYPTELKINNEADYDSLWSISGSGGENSKTRTTTFILDSGSRTSAEIKADLEGLRLILVTPLKYPPDNSTVSIQASAAKITSFQDDDGYLHYYTFVSPWKNWVEAYNDAKTRTMQDPRYPSDPSKRLEGYLATITSGEEQYKIYNDIAKQCGWLGGTRIIMAIDTPILDEESITFTNQFSRYWYWADGPEAGNIFNLTMTGLNIPNPEDAVPSGFTGWQTYQCWSRPTEPNNVGGEYCLQFAYNNEFWNDYSYTNQNLMYGYYVEFGGYEDDPTADELAGSDIVTSSEVELVMPIIVEYRSTVLADPMDPDSYRVISDIGSDYDRYINDETHISFNATRGGPEGLDSVQGYVPYGYVFYGTQEDRDALSTNINGDVSGFYSANLQRIVFLFKPVDYAVTFNANFDGWNSASVSQGSKTVQYDSPYGALATASRSGYTFQGWYQTPEDATSGTAKVAENDLYGLMENSTLYAGWELGSSYIVNYDLNDTDDNPADPRTIDPRENVSWTDDGLLPATPARNGYLFTGWDVVANGSKKGVTSSDTYESLAASDEEGSITLQAQWREQESVWVRFYLNGAQTPAEIPDESYLTGDNVMIFLQTPSRLGYVFNGWMVSNYGPGGPGDKYYVEVPYVTAAADSDGSEYIIFEAQWVAKEYTIYYDRNDGTQEGSGLYAYPGVLWEQNGLVPLGTGNPARVGYMFMGWNTVPNGLSEGTGRMAATGSAYSLLAGNDDNAPSVTLYAQWQAEKTFFVKYDTKGSSPVPDKTGVYLTTDNLLPADPAPPVGYEFAGWKLVYNGSKQGVTATDTFGGLADDPNAGYIVLEAEYSPKKNFTVTYNLNGVTGTVPAPRTGIVWTQISLIPLADPSWSGHVFLGWNTSAGGTEKAATSADPYSALAPNDTDAGIILYAQWSEDTIYTVRYELNGGDGIFSNVTFSNVTLLTDVLVPVHDPTAPKGYRFDRWIVADNGYGQNTGVTVNGQTYSELVYGNDESTWSNYIVLRAIYTEMDVFTVNYDWNYGNAPQTDTKENVKWTDSGFTPHAAMQSGRNLLGWSLSPEGGAYVMSSAQYGTLVANDDSVRSVTLYAQWEDAYFIVFCDLAGMDIPAGAAGDPYRQRIVGFDDTGLVPPGLDRVGYQLKGWVVSENGASAAEVESTDSYRTLAATGAPYITLQAQWEPKSYIVNYDTNGGTPSAIPPTTDGSLRWWSANLLPSEVLTKDGYTLAGWKLSKTGNITLTPEQIASSPLITNSVKYSDLAWDGSMDLASITLQAIWEPKTGYVVNYDLDGGSADPSLTPMTVSWSQGGLLPSGTITKSGYTLAGWKLILRGTAPVDPEVSVTSSATYEALALSDTVLSVTLQAVWETYRAEVVLDLDGEEWSGQTVELRQNNVLVKTMTYGNGLYNTDAAAGMYNIFVNGTATGKVLAVVQGTGGSQAVSFYTMTVIVVSGGTPEYGSKAVLAGLGAVFTITPDTENFTVSKVLQDGMESDNVSWAGNIVTVKSVTSKIVITVEMVEAHKVSISGDGGTFRYRTLDESGLSEWTIYSGEVSVPHGGELIFEAVPDEGFIFMRWGDGVKNNPRTERINMDLNFTADFVYTVRHYVIAATADNGSELSPSGSVKVTGGESVTFTFSAKEGMVISEVTVNGILLSRSDTDKGTYTFSNISGNGTIKVTSAEANMLIIVQTGSGHAEYSIGDSPFAVYGSPVPVPENASLAVRAYAASGSEFSVWRNGDAVVKTPELSFADVTDPIELGLIFGLIEGGNGSNNSGSGPGGNGVGSDLGENAWLYSSLGFESLLVLLGLAIWFLFFWGRSGLIVTVRDNGKVVEGVSVAYSIDRDGKIMNGTKVSNSRGKCRIRAKKGSVVTITAAGKGGRTADGLPAVVTMDRRTEYLELMMK